MMMVTPTTMWPWRACLCRDNGSSKTACLLALSWIWKGTPKCATQGAMPAERHTLRPKIAQKPCIVWSLGPKALYYESLGPLGIDLIPAPAEHHESMAQVERTVGHLCRKTEAFLRGSPEDPRRAAHNTLARVHGFSPLQWGLGRDCIF